MELTPHPQQLIESAEKMLINKQVDECFEVCNKAQLQIMEMKKAGMDANEHEYLLQNIGRIKRQLNGLMARTVRQQAIGS
jgi:hypothetical protein